MEFENVMEIRFALRDDQRYDDRFETVRVGGQWQHLPVKSIKVILPENRSPLVELVASDVKFIIPDAEVTYFTQL